MSFSRVPYNTEVLNPQHSTTTNKDILTLSQQPNLTDIIHSQQLKLLDTYCEHPIVTLPMMCVSQMHMFTGVEEGNKEEEEEGRFHWVEETSKFAWTSLYNYLQQTPPSPFLPLFTYLQLHRWASYRDAWSAVVKMPTCIE